MSNTEVRTRNNFSFSFFYLHFSSVQYVGAADGALFYNVKLPFFFFLDSKSYSNTFSVNQNRLQLQTSIHWQTAMSRKLLFVYKTTPYAITNCQQPLAFFFFYFTCWWWLNGDAMRSQVSPSQSDNKKNNS